MEYLIGDIIHDLRARGLLSDFMNSRSHVFLYKAFEIGDISNFRVLNDVGTGRELQ